MVLIRKIPDTGEKLSILSRDSQYDLACACATREDEHRRRSKDGKWIYPVTLPGGGTTFLFKTLLSNQCVNDCKYCPLRAGSPAARCSLAPEEAARVFFSYYRAGKVSGLFLSSAVCGSPDASMENINRVALLLRRERFRGYIHLKIIPGASENAIRQSLSLASAVSLNIETAGDGNFRHFGKGKDYIKDIIRPLEFISRFRRNCSGGRRIKQTTQFVVGASRETDEEIIGCSSRLYGRLGLSRIYFSSYQRGEGDPSLPGESSSYSNEEMLTREHRLYQADWLMRKYGFRAEEIPLGPDGNLSLDADPKAVWARRHPEFFPVEVNSASASRLLRVPGLGLTAVERIMQLRREGVRLRSLAPAVKRGKIMKQAEKYVVF